MNPRTLTLAALALIAPAAFSQEVVPGEILVKFHPGRAANEGLAHAAIKAEKIEEIPNLKIQRVKLPKGLTVSQGLAHYRTLSNVEYAEPNYVVRLDFTPNDPSYGSQWGLGKIGAGAAWDIAQGHESVRIAILDTGVDFNHGDLSTKIVGGWDFVRNDPMADDEHGHGTHVAGIAAASTNNGLGVAGLGFRSSIMPIKVMDNSGSGSYAWLVSGIRYAADNGAKVVSMSLGAPYACQAVDDAVNYAWSKGAVVVAAAGNSNSTTPHYPAYSFNAIAVASTDQWDAKSSFSNYGDWVDVAAPGSSILSTLRGGGYGYMSGTSMATPFVAGHAGLLWSHYGLGTSPSVIRQKIEQSADKVGTFVAFGRINVPKSMASVSNRTTLTPTTYSPLYAGATSGSLSAVAASDDVAFTIASRLMSWRHVADYYMEAKADFVPSSIEIDFVARQTMNLTGYATLYNWNTGRWDQIGSIPLTGTDASRKWTISSPAAYVSSTGAIRGRMWVGNGTLDGFTQHVDRFTFTVVR